MAWAFLIVGMIFLVSAIKGTQHDLWMLVKSDFTGSGNFFYWVLAIIIIVVLGNIKSIRPVTDAFLGLVILVIILAQYKGGNDLFSSFISQVKEGTA